MVEVGMAVSGPTPEEVTDTPSSSLKALNTTDELRFSAAGALAQFLHMTLALHMASAPGPAPNLPQFYAKPAVLSRLDRINVDSDVGRGGKQASVIAFLR